MTGGVDPISDDEVVYRRFPASMREQDPPHRVSPQAFRPTPEDKGLSVFRAKYHRPEDCAPANPGQEWYLAVLRVKDIREKGMEIVESPETSWPSRIGHAEIKSLNGKSRKEPRSEEWQFWLAEQLGSDDILGPYRDRLIR